MNSNRSDHPEVRVMGKQVETEILSLDLNDVRELTDLTLRKYS